MSVRTMSPVVAPSRLRILCLSIAALLICAVLLGSVFAGGAQAARSYSAQETAFINSLNQYRAANGLQPLLLSDAISEACYRHNHDMAEYEFFSHYSVDSDWFAASATPWTRMSASGYTYSTSKAENIAAGQSTAAEVLADWKASSGHNANMLSSAYKVVGVSFYTLAGSPYDYYWTTDFGGYVDPTAHAVGELPAPTTTRYQQNYSRFVYSGTWAAFSSTKASGGSYGRSSTSGASATIKFTGSRLDWIGMKGVTTGIADVYLDGVRKATIDLAASTAKYQVTVWSTGPLTYGSHVVKIVRSNSSAAGKFLTLDAVDVWGWLTS
jgi:uncharacterized protein YkwD